MAFFSKNKKLFLGIKPSHLPESSEATTDFISPLELFSAPTTLMGIYFQKFETQKSFSADCNRHRERAEEERLPNHRFPPHSLQSRRS